jgi:hypothetical protein
MAELWEKERNIPMPPSKERKRNFMVGFPRLDTPEDHFFNSLLRTEALILRQDLREVGQAQLDNY